MMNEAKQMKTATLGALTCFLGLTPLAGREARRIVGYTPADQYLAEMPVALGANG